MLNKNNITCYKGGTKKNMEGLTLAAIDFGSKKISISLGQGNDDDIEIMGSYFANSKGINKGIITDEEKCCQSLMRLVQEVEHSSVLNKLESVYVGISSRNIRLSEVTSSVNLREGKVRRADIKRAIEKGKRTVILNDGEEIVDTVINFFNIDENIVNENIIGWRANILSVNFTILIGESEELEKYKRIITNCGLTIDGFVPNVLSGRKVFLNEKTALGMKALIDIGAGTSDIALFNNGVLKYISSVPLGGDNITKDLSICGKFTLSEAENIKNIYSSTYERLPKEEIEVNVGSAVVSTNLFYEVTKARIEEIVEYVNLELKKTSFFEGICSIIIYGDGISSYENVFSLIEKQIDKKVKVIDSHCLGMENFSNISSLSIIKDMYDRLKLLYDYSIKEEFKEDEEIYIEKSNQGILGKLKNFLDEIF